MPAIAINKLRPFKVPGLTGLSITSPVAEWLHMQNNHDGTVSVVIGFYEDQAAFDLGEGPFETFSYQISSKTVLDTYLMTELKKQPDFDQST